MIQRLGQPIIFTAQFSSGGLPYDPAAAVLVTVFRITSAGALVKITDDEPITLPTDGGMAAYLETQTDVAGSYVARFRCTDAALDEQMLRAQQTWQIGLDVIELAAAQLPKIGGTSAAAAPGTIDAGSPVTAVTSSRFEQIFNLSGTAIAGWSKIIFTVKRSLDDSDADALLLVRATNPVDAATDGILIFMGKPVLVADPLRLAGLLVALATSPDSSVKLILTAGAMVLPTAPVNVPFVYEINYYAGGDKIYYMAGELTLIQSARRSIAIP
jgi:hypothetical protein